MPTDDLLTWQRCNHFSEAKHLTRKDLLKRQLHRFAAAHGRTFDVMPTTFLVCASFAWDLSSPGKRCLFCLGLPPFLSPLGHRDLRRAAKLLEDLVQ